MQKCEKELIFLNETTVIGNSEKGNRTLFLFRNMSDDYSMIHGGYPISRETLEYSVCWDVQEVVINAKEKGHLYQYTTSIEHYLNAPFFPVFDDEYTSVSVLEHETYNLGTA